MYPTAKKVVARISFSQECDSNGVRCITCTDYQTCNAGVPAGEIVSCKNDNGCTDNQLKQCQMKLNCFAASECTQSGIFPNPSIDSNYFVCLGDASSGFLKYDFTCPDGEFFDASTMACALKSATDPSSPPPTEPSSPPPTEPSSPPPTEPSSPSPTTPSSPPPTEPSSSPSTAPSSPPPTEPSSPPPTEPSSPPSTAPSSPPPTEPSSPPPTEPSSPPPTEPSSPPPTEPSSPPPTEPSSPPPTAPSSPLPTTPSSPPPTTPSSPSPTTEPPAEPFACPAPGIFPDPGNCKIYYRCSSILKAFLYICPGTSYFNEYKLKCSLIITPACQDQINKNSTSAPPPIKTTTSKPTPTTTITSTTTTTTTTTPRTTTTTTTPRPTTTTTTPPMFACPAPGIFPDPDTCKNYYRCSTTGKAFRYICPGRTYFNEFTNRCSLSLTPRCKTLAKKHI